MYRTTNPQLLRRVAGAYCSLLLLLATMLAITPRDARALERPGPGEIERYRADGTLAQRLAFARSLGNDRMNPSLIANKMSALGLDPFAPKWATAAASPLLASIGTRKVMALLIDFPDYPHSVDSYVVRSMLFGVGNPANYPYESLRSYYQRASYGALDIQGDVYGWYRAKNKRDTYTNNASKLIQEALDFYKVDRSQYDPSYFIVYWTGPNTGWASFWWGEFNGSYSWQWEADNPIVVIHETGHALGLPDYYDYPTDAKVGEPGGLGGFDMMDANQYDHNCFSKWMLGWLDPVWITSAAESKSVVMDPAGIAPEAVALMPGHHAYYPASEFFMVQRRTRVANDVGLPNEGFIVWHCDLVGGMFNNQTTWPKVLKLVEADGLNEIDNGGHADAADFFVPGVSFGATTASGDVFNGSVDPTNVGPTVTDNPIKWPGAPTGAYVRNIGLDGSASIGVDYLTPQTPLEAASVSSYGLLGTADSSSPSLSTDGRYVAFSSFAQDLAPNHTNGQYHAFLRDRQFFITDRVSVDDSGVFANFAAHDPQVSSDGRFIAYWSEATSLAPDGNNLPDVYRHDMLNGSVDRVSVSQAGGDSNGASGFDGNDYVGLSVDGDGQLVAFYSEASNLVPNDTNAAADVFVRDMQNHVTERVSVASDGTQGNGDSTEPSISSNGQFVAFYSMASNLVAGDTNHVADVFVRDRSAGTTERVSVASDGTQANGASTGPSISANGRWVAFASTATNLASNTGGFSQVYIHDRTTGLTELVSVSPTGAPANGNSYQPSVSADGRLVAFTTVATNLASDDTNKVADVYVRDRLLGTTTRVSLSALGLESNAVSDHPVISSDGTTVAFRSPATNLVADQKSTAQQIYVRSGVIPVPILVTVNVNAAIGVAGQTISLSAALGLASNGSPVGGETLSFAVGSTQVGSGTTDTNGVASVSYTIPAGTPLGTQTITVTHNPSARYGYAVGSAQLTVRSRFPVAFSLSSVKGTPGQLVTLRSLMYGQGAPLSGKTVTWAIDGVVAGTSVSTSTDVSLQYAIPANMAFGTHNVTVSFAGDTVYLPAARTTAALNVVRKLAFSAFASTGAPSQKVTLKTLVYSGGQPVSGLTIAFSVDGKLVGTAVSDSTAAALSYTIPSTMLAGAHDVTFAFAGDDTYGQASLTQSVLTVITLKSNVDLSIYAASGAPDHTVTLKSLMLSHGVAVVGRTVQFSVDGTAVGSGVSAAGGVTCDYVIPHTMTDGVHNVTVSFAGDATYNSATRTTAALTVAPAKANVQFSLYAVSGEPGQTVTLRSLMMAGGAALIGELVTFSVDGSVVGTGVTDAKGVTCSYTIPLSLSAGAHNVTVAFGGDRFNNAGSRTSPALTVVKVPTALALNPVSGSVGDTVNLSCVLTAHGVGVPSKTINFWIEGVPLGSATTDASGVAAMPYTIASWLTVGGHTVTVAFDGSSDPLYAGSTYGGVGLTVH